MHGDGEIVLPVGIISTRTVRSDDTHDLCADLRADLSDRSEHTAVSTLQRIPVNIQHILNGWVGIQRLAYVRGGKLIGVGIRCRVKHGLAMQNGNARALQRFGKNGADGNDVLGKFLGAIGVIIRYRCGTVGRIGFRAVRVQNQYQRFRLCLGADRCHGLLYGR